MSIQPIVVDTNVFVSALLNPFGKNADVLELCYRGTYQPVMSTALFLEYEDVVNREKNFFKRCLLTPNERQQALNDFFSVCRWVKIYYAWRPNLRDEGDNFVMELAIAAGVTHIVTSNIRDFRQSELSFPDISVVTADQFLKEAR
ncbi:MAG: putative toxin-antitoxin system toxin component, PIN family [Chloroflexota bacterium]